MQKLAETPQMRGEAGAQRLLLSVARPAIHDVLQLDAIDVLLSDPAGAVPPEGHAATLIQGHAYRPDTVVQAVTRQVAQFSCA